MIDFIFNFPPIFNISKFYLLYPPYILHIGTYLYKRKRCDDNITLACYKEGLPENKYTRETINNRDFKDIAKMYNKISYIHKHCAKKKLVFHRRP